MEAQQNAQCIAPGEFPHIIMSLYPRLISLMHYDVIKFNDFERKGVFVKREDVGVMVEYLNPSLLFKKSDGSFRLDTAFADVDRHSKPEPSLLPGVDSSLRNIA